MKEALLRALHQNDDPDDPDAAARSFASLLAQGWCSYTLPPPQMLLTAHAGTSARGSPHPSSWPLASSGTRTSS